MTGPHVLGTPHIDPDEEHAPAILGGMRFWERRGRVFFWRWYIACSCGKRLERGLVTRARRAR